MTRTGSADLSGLRIDRDAPKPPANGRRRGLIAGGLVLAVAVAVLFLLRVARPPVFDVTVATAESVGGAPGAGASEVLTASGYVVARQRASVSTEVAGRLDVLRVDEGSRVEKGDVLGILRNEDQRAAVASAEAALSASVAAHGEAKASAREADLELGRRRELLGRGLVSQSEFDAAEAKSQITRSRVESTAAEIENSRARLDAARIAYEKTFIRAPFSGAVLRKEAEVGEIVSPIPSSGGLTRGAIVTMANLATLEVEVDVNEGYVARAREGMRAEITLDAYPSVRYPGRVRQIVPTADRQKATVRVKATFDSLDARVLPEMGAKVTFLAEPDGPTGDGGSAVPTAVWIPKAAVREREGRAVVFVVDGDRVTARSVSPRPLGPDRVSVSGGLAAGERVVVEAPEDLTDRARVRAR